MYKLENDLSMKKFTIVLMVVLWSMSVIGQHKIETNNDIEKINDDKYPGVSSFVTGDDDDVEKAWRKYLKDFGKVKERKTYFELTEVTLADTYYESRIFYANMGSGEKVQTVWLGADTTGMSMAEWYTLSEVIQKHVYNFVENYYKDKVQEEIDESIKAEDYNEKQLKKFEKEEDDLKTQLKNNEKELIRLEQAIIDNKKEHEELLEKIEKNKVDQEDTAVSLEKIKKVIELQKEKKEAIK